MREGHMQPVQNLQKYIYTQTVIEWTQFLLKNFVWNNPCFCSDISGFLASIKEQFSVSSVSKFEKSYPGV